MQGLSIIWLKMSHFTRSVSEHGKCGKKLKLSPVGVHSCAVWVFLVVAMATTCENLSKNRKISIFCNFCNTYL